MTVEKLNASFHTLFQKWKTHLASIAPFDASNVQNYLTAFTRFACLLLCFTNILGMKSFEIFEILSFSL